MSFQYSKNIIQFGQVFKLLFSQEMMEIITNSSVIFSISTFLTFLKCTLQISLFWPRIMWQELASIFLNIYRTSYLWFEKRKLLLFLQSNIQKETPKTENHRIEQLFYSSSLDFGDSWELFCTPRRNNTLFLFLFLHSPRQSLCVALNVIM